MVVYPCPDRVFVPHGDERVDEPVRAAGREVGVREPEPAKVLEVVRRVEIPGDRGPCAAPAAHWVVRQDDLLLRDQERVRAEDLARPTGVLDGHEEGVRTEGLLGRELEHRWT